MYFFHLYVRKKQSSFFTYYHKPMTTIFTLTNDVEPADKINLDDLYEKRKEENLETLRLYNKILNKIHDRIKLVSRQRNSEQLCWYVVPEVILGVPRYNHKECVNYIVDKLSTNGFRVKYIHPNLVCVCWAHYVPNYVRTELKKKTGIQVDSNGVPLPEKDDEDEDDYAPSSRYDSASSRNVGLNSHPKKPSVRFNLKRNKSSEPNDTNNYKPTGKMVYNNSALESLENRLNMPS